MCIVHLSNVTIVPGSTIALHGLPCYILSCREWIDNFTSDRICVDGLGLLDDVLLVAYPKDDKEKERDTDGAA